MQMHLKETFFKTRRGRVNRALFVIDAADVLVLRVRGFGQAPVQPIDLESP